MSHLREPCTRRSSEVLEGGGGRARPAGVPTTPAAAPVGDDRAGVVRDARRLIRPRPGPDRSGSHAGQPPVREVQLPPGAVLQGVSLGGGEPVTDPAPVQGDLVADVEGRHGRVPVG